MDSSSNPVEIVDFLSDEDCESLISYYKKSPKPKRKYDFWKERVVPCTLVTSIKIRRLVEEIQYRIIGNTCRSYDEEYLYPDFSNLVYWGSGMELAVSDSDGSDFTKALTSVRAITTLDVAVRQASAFAAILDVTT